MKLEVVLNQDDYWTYSRRLVRAGIAEEASSGKHLGLKLLAWIALGMLFAFMLRTQAITSNELRNLVIALAVIAVFAAIATRILVVRQKARMNPLPNGFMLSPRTYTFDEQGYTEEADLLYTRIQWDAVIAILSDAEHVYIMLDRCAGHIIPKRSFKDAAEAESFVSKIRALREAHRS